MLESCMRPDLVTEITLQPVRRYGVDAAILFSDIVLPLKAVGVDLDIEPGRVRWWPRPFAPRPILSSCARLSLMTCRTSGRRSSRWWASWARPR